MGWGGVGWEDGVGKEVLSFSRLIHTGGVLPPFSVDSHRGGAPPFLGYSVQISLSQGQFRRLCLVATRLWVATPLFFQAGGGAPRMQDSVGI